MILSSRMMAPPSFRRRLDEKTLSRYPASVNPPRQEGVAVPPADQEDDARLVEARHVDERLLRPLLPREDEKVQSKPRRLVLLARKAEAQVEAGVDRQRKKLEESDHSADRRRGPPAQQGRGGLGGPEGPPSLMSERGIHFRASEEGPVEQQEDTDRIEDQQHPFGEDVTADVDPIRQP